MLQVLMSDSAVSYLAQASTADSKSAEALAVLHYLSLLPLLSELDRQAKGQAEGNPWQRLSDLNLKLASAN